MFIFIFLKIEYGLIQLKCQFQTTHYPSLKQVLGRTLTQTQLHLLIKTGHETVNRHLLHCLKLMGRDKAEMALLKQTH